MVTREWARTTDDILWRRSKLGLHFTAVETERLAGLVEHIAAEARLTDAEFSGGERSR